LIEEECDMAEKLIKKNFSNFSAWHYRAKLMPKILSSNGLIFIPGYVIPLETIK
jgi:hypothetical protein